MISKIALGTVQFGLDYGINNTTGQVSDTEVASIIDYCRMIGINTIDTAYVYGNSETVLGMQDIGIFDVISKLPNSKYEGVEQIFIESLNRLGVDALYAYMIHNFSIYKKDKRIWQKLSELKKKGLVKKIGASLYSPAELMQLIEDDVELDIIQIPYNLFDRRFEHLFPILKNKDIEVHTRSTFLQGLFFKQENFSDHFDSVRNKLKEIQLSAIEKNISISTLCLSFSLQNPFIDKVVIGVDSLDQLKDNIFGLKNQPSDSLVELDIRVDDLNIINPTNWKI